jgi:signal transduction histidine kinase
VVSLAIRAQEKSDARLLETSYSNYGELVLAVARVAFRVILAVRFLAFAGPWRGDPRVRVLVAAGSLVSTLAFSAWIAAKARRRAVTTSGHVMSAMADVALCFVSLLSTALWPERGYPGLLHKPDVAFLSILVFGSALRLVPAAIAASTVGSMTSLVVLARVDATVNASQVAYRPHDVQMVAILIGTAAVAAWFSSVAARRALLMLSRETQAVSRGQQHLRAVLRDHHDLRTLLSSARLQLDLLVCNAPTDDVRDSATTAAHTMTAIAEVIEGIRDRTFGETATGDDLAPARLADVVADAVAAVRIRFPLVTVDVTGLASGMRVVVFGGERALMHIVLNLLVNACEGDGRRGAEHVELDFGGDRARPHCVRIEVVDDGPGFPCEILGAGRHRGLTTKTEGGGMGLGLIAELVQASRGEITLVNRANGGARVSVWLPRSDNA